MGILIEKPLPLLTNLRPTYPYSPTVRENYTSIVYSLDSKSYINKLDGIKLSVLGLEELHREVKTFEDAFEFLIEAGTSYIPNPSNFIPLFIKHLGGSTIITLATPGVRDYPVGPYNVTLGRTSLLVRRGKRYGRVFSFWDGIPKAFKDKNNLDKYNLDTLSLQSFFNIFFPCLLEAQSYGLSLSTLHSAASILESLFLSTGARILFGHINDIDPIHMERANQCYKGSIFESSYCGYFDGYYYDIVSAYPSIAKTLTPCYYPYMDWIDTSEYQDPAFYGFLTCEVEPSKSGRYSPTCLRWLNMFGYRLGSFQLKQILNLTLPEYKLISGKLTGMPLAKIKIIEGSWGIPIRYTNPLSSIIDGLHELKENKILGDLIKLASQTVSGKMGSKWREDQLILSLNSETGEIEARQEEILRSSPIFQIIYSSHINGVLRAMLLYYRLKFNSVANRADGFIVPKEIDKTYLSDDIGGLKLKESGSFAIMDDMELITKSNLLLLDERLLSSNPKSSKYISLEKEVVSIMTALRESSNPNWKDAIGTVRIIPEEKEIGSHKRKLAFGEESISNFKKDGLYYEPIKTLQDFQNIVTNKRGYNGYA